jgi:hypothetical protein
MLGGLYSRFENCEIEKYLFPLLGIELRSPWLYRLRYPCYVQRVLLCSDAAINADDHL